MTASTSLVQTEAAPDMRGRVLALQAMVFLGSTPIGGPIVGWIAEDLGARYALAVGALACLGAGAWGVVVARRDEIDDRPRSSRARMAATDGRGRPQLVPAGDRPWTDDAAGRVLTTARPAGARPTSPREVTIR